MKTTKEKAQELFTNFRFVLSLPDAPLGENKDVIAKQCALICVDEMIKITAPECDKYEEYYFQLENSKKQEYWNEVKKELESL